MEDPKLLHNKIVQDDCVSKRVFGSVVAVAFQIAFRAEKHANNVFSFFKNYF